MDTMTNRQRLMAAFRHREPDRTPVFEYVLLSPVADAVLGRPYVDFNGDTGAWCAYAREVGFEQALRQYARDRVDLARILGHDMIYCIENPTAASLYPQPPKQYAAQPPEEDDPVERIAWANACRREELTQPEDESRYLVYGFLREELERQGMDIPLYMPAFAHGIWTNVDLMETMIMDPDTAHAHFELCTHACIRKVKRLAAEGADIIGIGGDFAGNRPLISPEAYRTYIVPELKTVSDLIHSLGRYAVNASDGDLWSVIEDFLIHTGVDAYGEVDFSAGMDLKKLKQRFGDRITFLGNMDCGNVLSFASHDRIRELSIRCIEDGLGAGGHVFSASNAISASVSVENYLAMVNAYRDYFAMERIRI